MQRTWGFSEQKVVAYSQNWKCASCAHLLPASFELDHVTPLWDGGADCYETNAQALCPSCHAKKTQIENIERQKKLRKIRLDAYEKCEKKPRIPITVTEDTISTNPFLKFAYVKNGHIF